MDTGSDTGNFLGVGIYVLFNEVVFISEMEAGWAPLHRPVAARDQRHHTAALRFRRGRAPCARNVHHHHVDPRFDFDIRTAGNNQARECFNDPPLIGNQNWHTKRFKIRRPRYPGPGAPAGWRGREHHERRGLRHCPAARLHGLAVAMPDVPFGRGENAVDPSGTAGSEIHGRVVADPVRRTKVASIAGSTVKRSTTTTSSSGTRPPHLHQIYANDYGPALHGHVLGPDLKPINW